MVLEPIHCPQCDGVEVIKHGTTSDGKQLTLRTRIKRTPLAERSSMARKTICFSKSVVMHDIVIGLFLNRYEFGLPI